MILKYAPDAHIWIRFQSTTPPLGWCKKHPDELLIDAFGQQPREPSLASDSYIEQLERYIENVIRFCERQDWAGAIAGYVLYPLGEGTTQLAAQGHLFDQSPAMSRAFRQFLRRRYQTDTALQDAWGCKNITLDTVTTPRDQDFLARGRTRYDEIVYHGYSGKRTPHRLHWPEPQEIADARDYCDCMRELTVRCFRTMLNTVRRLAPHRLTGLDAFKGNMLGWPLVPRFLGDYQSHQGIMHASSGAYGMAELLNLPELDVVATPHDYLDRSMGAGYDPEGIGDAVVAAGKVMMVEEDQRTRTVNQPYFNPLKTDAEIHAGFWRNFGAAIARGFNSYPMEICGQGSYYDDPVIQEILTARARVQTAATFWERHEVSSLCMVFDDWSVIDEDISDIDYLRLASIDQRLYGLARCGVPFKVHLLEDLARENFPDCHRVFYFPNLYRLDEKRHAQLKDRLFRNGNVIILGPATGMVTRNGTTAERISDWSGMPFTLLHQESPRHVSVNNFTHPITRRFRQRIDYGDSYPYGPILVPEESPEVTRLGHIQLPAALDGAGLVIREFGLGAAGNGRPGVRGEGDYAIIFSTAVPLPAPLLRECCRYAGVHVYSEEDDLIWADSCTLTVHSVYSGTRSVALPQKTTVWDLINGECLGQEMESIQFTVNPPQTRMFYLDSGRGHLAGRSPFEQE